MNARWEFRILMGLGIVIVVLAAILIRKGERRRALSFALAWLVPGAGHAAMGRWKKGLFLFALLGLTYLSGLWIVGFRSVSFDDNPFYFVGRYGSGATLFLAKAMSVEKSYPREGVPISWYDPALLYVCVVGLLNLVLMMNILEVRPPSPPAAAPAKPGAAPADAPPAPEPAPEKPA